MKLTASFGGFVVAGLVGALLLPVSIALAQQADPVAGNVLERRVIDTDDLGVNGPTGLVIDRGSDTIYVIGEDPTSLAGFTPAGNDAGTIALAIALDPLNTAFDSSTQTLVTITSDGVIRVPLDGGPTTVIGTPNLAQPSGLTLDEASGEIFVLEAGGSRVTRIDPAGGTERFSLDAPSGLAGIAHNPVDSLLYVGVPAQQSIRSFDMAGAAVATFDVSPAGLVNPGAMAFSRSTDPTDAAADTTILVLDAAHVSNGGSAGRLVELSLGPPAPDAGPLALADHTVAVLENTINAWTFNPPSPDSAGITFFEHTGNLFMSDSEVNEMTIFQNVNLWELTLSGGQVNTGVTVPWSSEPTGVSYNPDPDPTTGRHRLYVSQDDGGGVIFDVDPVDSIYGNGDDVILQTDAGALGIGDVEGLAFDRTSGNIFVSDGVASEVYEVDPGPDGDFDGVDDSLVGPSFDIGGFGAGDPEGIVHNHFDDTLLIVDDPSASVYEVTKTGTLVRTIDISAAPLVKAAGITLAPASDGSPAWHMYIADRGIDNGADPFENDGRIFEMSLDFGPVGNPPVAVDDADSTIEDTPVVIDVAANDSDPDGDLDPSTAVPSTQPGSGLAAGNGDGTITYTPDPDTNGADSFTYRICDLGGACDSATVDVTVAPVDDPPVAVDDSAATAEDTAVVIDVAANDSDPDGDLDPGSAAPAAQPANGTAAGNGDGTITYTPNGGFSGLDTFDYQICDLTAMCATATATVRVGGIGAYYVSFSSTTVVPGITGSVSDEDIVVYDPDTATWAMFFDASDVGITSSDLDAFHVRDDGSVLMSYSSANFVVPGLTGGPDGEVVDDSDVFVFDPTSVGETTAGSFSFFFDGSDVDLTTNGEDVDGLYEFADGTLAISTTGSITVGALPGGGDEDLHLFDPATTGAATTGTWTGIHFDGGDIGLLGSNDDVNGASFDVDGDLLYSTVGLNTTPGSDNEDINRFSGTFGINTAGTTSIELDLSSTGIPTTASVDALHASGGGSSQLPGPPVAVDDAATTPEDTAVVVDVAANDSDPDGDLDPSTAAPSTQPASGAAVGNGDGTITYTPDPDTNGGDSFTYQICDLAGACDTATVNLTVTAVDDPPVAVDDSATTPEVTPVVIDVAANDSDVDNNLDPGSAAPAAQPANGTAAGNGDGTITYTPNGGFSGVDTFDYQICDTTAPTPLCDTAIVSVTVADQPQPPVANDDSATTAEDTPVVIDVALNDTDPDGDLDPTTAAPATQPTNGTATGNGDGTITYTPDPDTNGADTFTYQICDLTALCATATVDVTVAPVDDPPVAVDDSAATAEDTAVVIDVAANDTDPDNNLDPTTAAPAAQPANGTAAGNGDGTITYTPNGGFSGTDTFTYQICDTTTPTPLCDTATTTIDVGGIGAYYVSFSSTTVVPGITGSVSDEDIVVYDPDTGTWAMFFDASDVGITSSDLDAFHVRDDGSVLMSYSSANFVVPGLTGGPDGEVVDDSDVFVFDPTSVGETTAGSFSFHFDGSDVDLTTNGEDIDGLYEFADGTLAISTTGSITVGTLPGGGDEDLHLFDPATTGAATTGTWTGIHFDGGDIGLLGNNDDVNGASFDLDGDLLYSTTGLNATPGSDNEDINRFSGTFGINTAGTTSIELDLSTTGIPTTANVDALHASGGSSQLPGPPVAVDDSATTPEDTAVVVDVAANDSDPDGDLDPTTAAPLTQPASGTAAGNGDGTITYTPDLDTNGGDSFTYQICDLAGACDSASVNLTVTAVDDPPVAVDDSATTPEVTPVVIDVAANDSDPDNNLDPTSAAPTAQPPNGTASPNGDGTITYTPNGGFSGVDTFEYQICDTTAPTPLCDTAIVSVTVADQPQPPVAVDDSATTAEDTPVVIDVAANDSDPDGDLDPTSAAPATQPTNGTAAGNGDGTITYTPDPDTNGADTFTYQICDLTALCATATVNVTVTAVDDPPVAVDDSAATAEDTPISIDVAANDTDPDNNLNPSSAAPDTQPPNGTATGNGDGTITYTPNGGFSGTDTFEYQICDTTAPTPLCDTATTTIDVGPAPTGAEFRSHTTASTEDATFLTIPKPSGVVAGDVLVAFLMNSQNGSISWTPPPGWVQIGTEQATGAYAATAWYLVAQGTEPADFTWSMGANNETVGAIFAIAGADTANPIAAQQAVSDGLPSAISVTTSVDDALLILWGAQDAVSPQTWSNPDGMVEHFDETVTTTELTHGGYTGPSGPAGVHTRTIDGTAGSSPLGWLVAITPDT